MVFIIHAWICPGTKPSPIGAMGYIAVDCFFALSAFLITSLLIRERALYGAINYRKFIIRRGLRIWPLFYAVLFFSCVLLPLLNLKAALPLYGEFLLKQVLPSMLFCFNFAYPVNHRELADFSIAIGIPVVASLVPFWTLCIEEHFYTVWPLIVSRARTLSMLTGVIASAEVFNILVRCAVNWLSFNVFRVEFPFQLYFMNTFCHLDPLLIGAFLAILYHQKPHLFVCGNRQGIALSGVLAGLLTYCFSNMYLHFPSSSPMMIVDMTATALTAGLGLYLIMSWSPVRQFFAIKQLAAIGRVSFAIYLFHNFILSLVERQISTWPLPDVQWSYFLLKCIIAFPITYVLALLSWKYLESPCHKLKKHFEHKAVDPA